MLSDDELAAHRLLLHCGRLADHAKDIWLGAALRGLAGRSSMFAVHVCDDGDDITFNLVVYAPGGGVTRVAGSDFDAVVRRLIDGEHTKICSGCKAEKPLNQFTTCRSEPDGRHHACRKCEAARVSAYKRARRAARRAAERGGPIPPGPRRS